MKPKKSSCENPRPVAEMYKDPELEVVRRFVTELNEQSGLSTTYLLAIATVPNPHRLVRVSDVTSPELDILMSRLARKRNRPSAKVNP